MNPYHEVGKHKARVFRNRLGFEQKDADVLKMQILQGVKTAEVNQKHEDEYGMRYTVDIKIRNDQIGRSEIVATVWMIPIGRKAPRLITCYIKT